MQELTQRFIDAKENYQELIKKDFPDFNVEEYIQIKTQESNESSVAFADELDQSPTTSAQETSLLAGVTTKKLDIAEINNKANILKKNAASAVKNFGDSVGRTVTAFDASQAIDNTKVAVQELGKTISDTEAKEVIATVVKIGKTASGVQGIQNRSATKDIQKICSEYYNAASEVTERKRLELNYIIEDFGEYRLRALGVSVGRFLHILKKLNQKNAVKQYEILSSLSIGTKTIDEMKSMDMKVSEAFRTTAIAGAFASAAALGTPALVTGTVTALASASTGTAISTLSGAAANSAVLAWLGGGSLAAGGGGMAAGAAVLTTITTAATGAMTILTAGTMMSLYFGKKLTEAKDYEKEVGVTVATLEEAWIIMSGISRRAKELREVTEELKWRTSWVLDELEAISDQFDFENALHVALFQKCALLVKAMADLAQTPLLNDEGNLSDESIKIVSEVYSVLNTEV